MSTIITIELKDLSDAKEILTFGRNNYINECVYEFWYEDKVMKYGISTKQKNLERVYRQAGNIPGWNSILQGSSGADMLKLCIESYPNIHKNDVNVIIHDMHGKSEQDCLVLENKLVQNHVQQYGYRPPGNIKDTNTARMRATSAISQFNLFFDVRNNEPA
jgi:hypothetical protein